jgi:hypothetical protein
MESETRVLVEELGVSLPDVSTQLNKIYVDFESDAIELTQEIVPNMEFQGISSSTILGTEGKIKLFTKLKKENKQVETLLDSKNPTAGKAFKKLFGAWAEQIIQMRLIQERETIKGLLVTSDLAKTVGLPALENAMARVQEKFGQETVSIALDVTLKVGLHREKLQSVMLSDHFINYNMTRNP